MSTKLCNPKRLDARLFVHSGQVQVGEAEISNDDWNIEQDQDGDIGPMLRLVKNRNTFNIPVKLQTLQECKSC